MVVVLPESFDTPLQVILMCDSYIGLDQVYNIDLYEVNNKIEIDMPEKTATKYYSDEEIDTQENKADKDSDNSFDGFESYNLMRKYQESLQRLEESNQDALDEEQESFEFDVQPEDIYDLTMF